MKTLFVRLFTISLLSAIGSLAPILVFAGDNGSSVAETPTNLVRQISGADHIVVRYTFVNPPGLTNFSHSLSGDRLKKVAKAVSTSRQHHGTITSWGWEMLFYKGTNCLASVRFSDDFFVDSLDRAEYMDGGGTFKQLYQDVLSEAHFNKKD